MKIKHLNCWQIKGMQIKIFCGYFFKTFKLYYFSTVVVVSSNYTYSLLNNSNIAYFWLDVFNKLNRTFILMGCREYL